MKQRILRNLILVLVYVLFLGTLLTQSDPGSTNESPTAPTKRTHKPADSVYDILKVKEAVKKEFVEIWKHTESVYQLHDNTTQAIMNDYWHKLLTAFNNMNDIIKYFDRKIQRAQPSSLMNLLFVTPDMEFLNQVSTTQTQNDSIHWHMRFLEISSLTTQANWFYNKRMYDLLHVNKYLKSIADSISTLYGYPWLAEISIKKGGNITSRLQMRAFWRLSRMLIGRETHHDIFFGIRKLIDQSAHVLNSASVDAKSCTGQPFGEIVPIRLDAPIYVCMFLTLFHVKMFILRNLSYIYEQVYEGIVYPGMQQVMRNHVDEDIDNALRLFNQSFFDYHSKYGFKLVPVMRGYFLCDPPTVDPKYYIQVTNFYNVFLVPQLFLDPTEKCDIPCHKIGTKDPLPIDCDKPKNDKEKRFCLKLPCPLEAITCSTHNNPRAVACPSRNPGQLYDWYEVGFKHFGPATKCQDSILGFTGSSVNLTNSKGSSTTKQGFDLGTRASENVNDESPVVVENCEVCQCQCSEPLLLNGFNKSVRIFSLKSALANMDENRVVVGARFRQVDDQIHLEIADAVLKPNFYVDMSTVVWRNAKAADPTKPGESVRLSKNLKSMYLHSAKVTPDYVITGIRFLHSAVKHEETKESTQYIGIEIMQSKIDASTGTLIKPETEWIQKKTNYTGNSVYAGYGEPDSPFHMEGISFPDSSAEQLISFRTTSMKKNGGQLVIPFLDKREVVFPEKPFALKGIGIYHRHKLGFGGFIGIKVLPYEDKSLR